MIYFRRCTYERSDDIGKSITMLLPNNFRFAGFRTKMRDSQYIPPAETDQFKNSLCTLCSDYKIKLKFYSDNYFCKPLFLQLVILLTRELLYLKKKPMRLYLHRYGKYNGWSPCRFVKDSKRGYSPNNED